MPLRTGSLASLCAFARDFPQIPHISHRNARACGEWGRCRSHPAGAASGRRKALPGRSPGGRRAGQNLESAGRKLRDPRLGLFSSRYIARAQERLLRTIVWPVAAAAAAIRAAPSCGLRSGKQTAASATPSGRPGPRAQRVLLLLLLLLLLLVADADDADADAADPREREARRLESLSALSLSIYIYILRRLRKPRRPHAAA